MLWGDKWGEVGAEVVVCLKSELLRSGHEDCFVDFEEEGRDLGGTLSE